MAEQPLAEKAQMPTWQELWRLARLAAGVRLAARGPRALHRLVPLVSGRANAGAVRITIRESDEVVYPPAGGEG